MFKTEGFLKGKCDFLLFVPVLILGLLGGIVSVNNIILTSDSMTYGLVSQQILAGNGLRVPLTWFDSSAVPSDGTVPLLMHPPLFPTLLALFGGVTSHSLLAAQILNIIFHSLIGIFTYLMVRILFENKAISFVAGSLSVISLPLLQVAHHIWSETMFIAFTVATLYYLIRSRLYPDVNYMRNVIVASIFSCAAILTRNAGISLIMLFFWELMMVIKNKKSTLPVVVAFLLPVITVIILFARNYLIAHSVRGDFQWPVNTTYLEAFVGAAEMLFSQFQLGVRSTVFIVVIVTSSFIVIMLSAIGRREFINYFKKGFDLIIVFVLSYFGLIWFALAEKQPSFEVRFMAPLVPFLIIIILCAPFFTGQMLRQKGLPRLASIILMAGFSSVCLVTGYKTVLNLTEFSYKQEKLYSILRSCIYEKVVTSYGKETIIATNLPYQLSFFGGYPTVVLPRKPYLKGNAFPQDMNTLLPSRLKDIGSNVIALFDRIDEEKFGSYITGLSRKTIHNEKLELAYECPDGVIYHLKQ